MPAAMWAVGARVGAGPAGVRAGTRAEAKRRQGRRQGSAPEGGGGEGEEGCGGDGAVPALGAAEGCADLGVVVRGGAVVLEDAPDAAVVRAREHLEVLVVDRAGAEGHPVLGARPLR